MEDIASKLVNLEKAKTEIGSARTVFCSPETITEIVQKHGFNSEIEFWEYATCELMKCSNFRHLLRNCYLPIGWCPEEIQGTWSQQIERIDNFINGSFRVAFDNEKQPWFTKKGKELLLDPREAAKWLLSKPTRAHIVPPGLKAFLQKEAASERTQQAPQQTQPPIPMDIATSKTDALGPAKMAGRKKRLAPQFDKVVNAMKAMDRDFLKNMKEEAMQEEFGASRDTCRKARNSLIGG